MRNNQKGFSAVEGLLLLVIVGITGGVGIYVYQSRYVVVTPADSTTQSNAQQAEELSVVQKENKATYTNGEFKFSIQYPKDWELNTSDRRTHGPIDAYSGDTYLVSIGYPGSQHDFNHLYVVEGNLSEAMSREAWQAIQDTSIVNIVDITKNGHKGKKITPKDASSGLAINYFFELSSTKTLLYEDILGGAMSEYATTTKGMFDSLSFQ